MVGWGGRAVRSGDGLWGREGELVGLVEGKGGEGQTLMPLRWRATIWGAPDWGPLSEVRVEEVNESTRAARESRSAMRRWALWKSNGLGYRAGEKRGGGTDLVVEVEVGEEAVVGAVGLNSCPKSLLLVHADYKECPVRPGGS